MQSQRLDDLFFRYCEKNITGQEHDELMSLLLLDENREQINGLIDRLIRDDHAEHHLSREMADDILSSIFTATSPKIEEPEKNEEYAESPAPLRYLWVARLAAAAVTLLLLYGGYQWLNKKEQKQLPVAVLKSVYGEDAPAGGTRASLTLANGDSIDLTTATSENLAGQPWVTINKTIGQITYSTSPEKPDSITYNVLRTPLGGQYKIVLPDGTRAWLNAGSSLRYPTAFTGSMRHVEMSGEVYFEVEKNKKMPFQVRILDRRNNDRPTEITVLGTHFNISSYCEEANIQTTLLEGSVKVEKGDVAKILSPGQQARIAFGEQQPNIAVKLVDTESVVAWKEGRFEFNGNIREIMRQISRWYDLDVTYEGNVEKKSFAGTISRKNNVSEVLKMLELTGGIQFRIEDRKITVKNTD
ncbi:FecR family protein [Dyadobacter luticola]|uniref:DUF4974 domain-containing protein n=1 Tax=Dyadobacter luticola TaxID=1979387 RepID=A0A5R9L1B1_9BACT|nr:FecR family protein [Dyadobacter luticola]TLV02139.1 DUF4974 domain-containing protein [Dyadobacter luticola]